MPRHKEPVCRPEARATHLRALTACAVFIAVFAAVALTARDPGITWDEPIYLRSALDYRGWFADLSADSFSEESVVETWWQPDHPPLAKLWIALSISLFGWVGDPIGAARLGAGVLYGALAAVLFLWIAGRKGWGAGLIGAAVFVLTPRLFAHGHFANIEMPLLLLVVLTTVSFERGIRDRRWSVVCGACFGLALLTKINAVFLPAVLLPWGFLFHGRKAVRNALCMAALGPVIFFAGWPVMWHHPFQATAAYLANKFSRATVSTYYLGTTYAESPAPWHYPFVYLLATTPLLILVSAVAGMTRTVRGLRAAWRTAGHEALVLGSFALPVLLLAVPGVPKYDGVRLMLAAYPFLAVLAAYGADGVLRRIISRRRRFVAGLLVVGAALWLLCPIVLLHPFQLSYYGELVGGPSGAKKAGFETTYWHETFNADAIGCLNSQVPDGGRVALVGVEYRVWQLYHALGEIRPDIRHTNFEACDWDYLVVVMRESILPAEVKEVMRKREPTWERRVSRIGGPPVCLIYPREATPPAPRPPRRGRRRRTPPAGP